MNWFGRKKAKEPCVVAADDVSTIRAIVRGVSSQFGFKTFEARNAMEAVEVSRRQKPKLIVLDLEMGGTDGLAALRQLRADSDFASTPIIILSGSNEPEVVQRTMNAGATDFVPKDSLPNVTARIKHHLGKLSAES